MNNNRREKRDLTIDEIVDRAMEIAQLDGERGLTMRRVAEACGVSPMAIYHHVADKEALLTAVVDRVVADAIDDFGSTDRPWREDLVEFLCRYRAGFLEHPTAAQVYLRRPVISPELARCTELMFDAFERGGLRGRRVADATDAVVLLVMGAIGNDLTRPPAVRHELLRAVAQADAPRLNREIDSYSNRDPEARFRETLAWLLDGLLHAE